MVGILKLLSKTHVMDILKLLKKNDEMYFTEILRKINIHKSNLSKLLLELENSGLVISYEVRTNRRFPKKYYKLSKKGLKALQLCTELEKLDNEEFNYYVNISNSIIANNINNSNINIKKR